jgi:hypothetical protein
MAGTLHWRTMMVPVPCGYCWLAALLTLCTGVPGASREALQQASQQCQNAHHDVYHSTIGGECAVPTCTVGCQALVDRALEACINDTYAVSEDPSSSGTMRNVTRAFNHLAVQGFRVLGAGDCRYFPRYNNCSSTCTAENINSGFASSEWPMLDQCVSFSASAGAAAHSTWQDPMCTTPKCTLAFQGLLAHCRPCNDVAVQDLLADATINLAACNHTCDTVVEVVSLACCAGSACGKDGLPTVCQVDFEQDRADQSLWMSPQSSCRTAVNTAALTLCPERFYEDARLLGLFLDCDEREDKSAFQDLKNAVNSKRPATVPAEEHTAAHGFHVTPPVFAVGLVVLLGLQGACVCLLCSRRNTLRKSRRWKINTANVASTSIYDPSLYDPDPTVLAQ